MSLPVVRQGCPSHNPSHKPHSLPAVRQGFGSFQLSPFTIPGYSRWENFTNAIDKAKKPVKTKVKKFLIIFETSRKWYTWPEELNEQLKELPSPVMPVTRWHKTAMPVSRPSPLPHD